MVKTSLYGAYLSIIQFNETASSHGVSPKREKLQPTGGYTKYTIHVIIVGFSLVTGLRRGHTVVVLFLYVNANKYGNDGK